ncbi:amino acid ABC transporter permease [Mesorhizobium sp. SP-1A]|uniref:amino acid ABC transporter permease n=1 Tax=Mesorhizobium sp. SP-1A TaxID=3077840 RepID=UPI0028F74801|nr:amino acid ABC transporter permease [Mesorhizobium sp. SP-1A]
MSFDFPAFWAALTSEAFFRGACITIALSLLAHGVGILISVPVAVIIDRGGGFVPGVLKGLVGMLRGAPTLLQLLFVWNALPQFFPIFREPWFTPFLAAWIALSLNEAAYQVEINRAALKAVDPGQQAAGEALGLSRFQIFRYITLPQAMRVAIPPTVNEFITLLKITSLASVISLQELMSTASRAVSTTFQFSEYYAAALIYYLIMVYALVFLQGKLERKYSWDRSKAEAAGDPGVVQKAMALMRRA